MVVIYQKPDDPYLADVVVSIITKLGMYLNGTQAQYMIGQQKVLVNGLVEKDPAKVLKPGIYDFTLGERNVVVDIREMESL